MTVTEIAAPDEGIRIYVDAAVEAKRGSVEMWPFNPVMPYLSDSDAGWVAGLVDGEGTIGLTAHQSAHRRRSHNFSARVKISGTSKEMLNEVRLITRMGTIMPTPEGENRKPQFLWHCAVSDVQPFLQRIAPILRLKRTQAELVLVYLQMQQAGKQQGHRGLAMSAVPHALEIYRRLRELNRRGIAYPPGTEKPDELIEFRIADPKERKTTCDEPGCTERRYHKWRWCWAHWMKNRDPITKVCEQCKQSFETRNELKRFCTDRCQQIDYADRQRGGPKIREARKLTEEQVREILALWEGGEHSPSRLAERYGVNRCTVGDIIKGRTWAHLRTKE